jgi:drug/metabolite transporter (DMT)-like permease
MAFQGELAALATALCWAATGLFFTEAARRIGAVAVNLLRLPIAWVLLSAALALTGTPFAGLDGQRVTLLALSGLLGLTLGDLALFRAMVRIGPRLSSLLMALAPAFATLAGAVLLGERPGAREAIGMAVTLAGVVWVLSERRGGGAWTPDRGGAIALAVFAAACQGIGLVLAKWGMAGVVAPLAATWVRMGVATVGMLALAAGARQLALPSLVSAARGAAGPVLGGAIFGPFVGVWLSLVAARHADIGVAATLMATTPVLIIPLLAWHEGYRPTPRAVLGAAITVAGVALLFWK